MENPIKMDDLGGTIIFGNTHMQWYVKIWIKLPTSHAFKAQIKYIDMLL